MAYKISVLTPSIRPEGLKIVQECLARQTFQDFEWLVELGIPEKGCDLNAAFNRMLRRAKGELCVFYQDWIRIPDEGLQRFWEGFTKTKTPMFTTAPVGQTLDWEHVEWDWRKHPESTMNWHSWEIDWASAPLSALKAIGGFDEELDANTWSGDNVNVGLRADMAGYQFAVMKDNSAVHLSHNKITPHPFLPKQDFSFNNQRLDEIRRGLKINYVS